MKDYIVIAKSLTISPGAVLRLNPEQAQARLSGLQKTARDTYSVISPLTFVYGEIIGIEGNTYAASLQDPALFDRDSQLKKPKKKK